jgi:transposase
VNRSFCEGCFEKQRRIDELTEENERLKQALHYRQRRENEGFFGSSTPSSKVPVKTNTAEEPAPKPRGAKQGHRGHGRACFNADAADEVIELAPCAGDACPHCGGALRDKETKVRRVVDCAPVKARRLLYRLPTKVCAHCGRTFAPRPPSVLPKNLYGNQLLAQAAAMHYLHGIPLGRVCAQFGVEPGALVGAFHRLATWLAEVPEKLIPQYRRAPAKHADETGWRTHGKNGYAWLFATDTISLFQFHNTRSGTVPQAALGKKPLPGALVVDRYAGYNRSPCKIQYCFSHLLREVEDLEKDFPDSAEVKMFVAAFAPLLALAMKLRAQPITDAQFYARAARLKKQVTQIVNSPANHPGIQRVQAIFRQNPERLYHWVKDRRVPAENNLAERDLRPTVIARKTSFGSQSDAGAKTRGILMTVLHTVRKQYDDPTLRLKTAMDAFAINPSLKPFDLLFKKTQRKSPRH